MAGQHVVLGDPSVTSPYEIIGQAPELRFTETDQTDPAGRFRFRVNGDEFWLERSTGASWASNQWLLNITNSSAYATKETAWLINWGIFVGDNTLSSDPSQYTMNQFNRMLAVTTGNTAQTFILAQLANSISASNTRNFTATPGWVTLDFSDDISGSGTVTDARGIRMRRGVGAGATVTNWYGVYIEDPTGAGTLTNNYAIYMAAQTKGATLDVGIYVAGADTASFYSAGGSVRLADSVTLGLGTGSALGSPDATLTYNGTNVVLNPAVIGAGVIVLGGGEAGVTAPTGTTLRAPDVTTGGAGNIAGADLTIRPGLGTGTGDPGQVIFQVMPVAAAGDNIQVAATLLTLDGGGTELAMTPVAQSGTPSTTGAWFNQAAQTFTDNVTAAAGTVAAMVFNSVQIPIFDALNGAAGANRVTATDAATWYIAGPPAPTTDKTLITNPWALWIDDGNVRFDGNIYLFTSGSYIQTAAGQTIIVRVGVANQITFGFGGGGDGPGVLLGTSFVLRITTSLALQSAAGASIGSISDAGLQALQVGLKANSATEIGLQVTNGTLTVGTEGSIEAPYLSQTGAAFTDALGGNLDGCIGINYDSDTGPTASIEARVEGAWLSVVIAGVEWQGKTTGGKTGWWHPNQLLDPGWVDETVCIVCGERMQPGDSIALYANYYRQVNGRQNLHSVGGHQHLERDPEIARLKAQIWAQGEEIKDLKRQLVAA